MKKISIGILFVIVVLVIVEAGLAHDTMPPNIAMISVDTPRADFFKLEYYFYIRQHLVLQRIKHIHIGHNGEF